MRKIYKKMMVLLDRKQKGQMIGIVFMMLIGGILESLGISLIVPVMTVVIDPWRSTEQQISERDL